MSAFMNKFKYFMGLEDLDEEYNEDLMNLRLQHQLSIITKS